MTVGRNKPPGPAWGGPDDKLSALRRSRAKDGRRLDRSRLANPEEFIAAAHAGCFTMALAFQLQGGGYTPTELRTEAAVTLDPEGQGFRITRSALTLRATVPNLDEATFARMAGDVQRTSPVSKPLHVGKRHGGRYK